MRNLMKLTHVRLLVTDFPACFRFYRDVMGLTATWGAVLVPDFAGMVVYVLMAAVLLFKPRGLFA